LSKRLKRLPSTARRWTPLNLKIIFFHQLSAPFVGGLQDVFLRADKRLQDFGAEV
jgi:hypothetical protein